MMHNDAMAMCTCGHLKLEHMSVGHMVCLAPAGCVCAGFEPAAPAPKPPMFSVRIDKEGDGYVFKIEPMPHGLEMIAFDSKPGVIAFIEAEDPGAAAKKAWDRAVDHFMARYRGLPTPNEQEQLP